MLVVAVVLLYLAGARGFLLLVLAFAVSALASYVLLSKQREVMAGALNRRLSKAGRRATEFRARLEEGAAAEDDDTDADPRGADDRGVKSQAARDKGADLAEARDRT